MTAVKLPDTALPDTALHDTDTCIKTISNSYNISYCHIVILSYCYNNIYNDLTMKYSYEIRKNIFEKSLK